MSDNDSLIRLTSGRSEAAIDPVGAQLRRLTFQGEPILWPGDKAVWKDSSPWLFPVIGQLKDGSYTYKGRRYTMPMHGFARRARFDVNMVSGAEAAFTLRASDETKAVYPFDFQLTIRYALTENALDISASVENAGQEDMPYSLGAHPGLICGKGDALIFPGLSSLTCRRLTPDTHLLRHEKSVMPLNNGALTLHEDLFRDDAILVEAPAVREVTLRRQAGPDVTLRFDAAPWLGIWSRGTSPLRYVCLEPWLGVDDPVDADGDITRKEAIQTLPAGQSRTFRLSVTR